MPINNMHIKGSPCKILDYNAKFRRVLKCGSPLLMNFIDNSVSLINTNFREGDLIFMCKNNHIYGHVKCNHGKLTFWARVEKRARV